MPFTSICVDPERSIPSTSRREPAVREVGARLAVGIRIERVVLLWIGVKEALRPLQGVEIRTGNDVRLRGCDGRQRQRWHERKHEQAIEGEATHSLDLP